MSAEASCKFLDDDQWGESLGNREEIEHALKVSINSLRVAANSFSKEEIAEARRENLFENHELQEIIASQRQSEMQRARNEQQTSDSSKQSQKR